MLVTTCYARRHSLNWGRFSCSLANVRDDTKVVIGRFFGRDTKRLMKQGASVIEELESRLSPERNVEGVLYTICYGMPDTNNEGILLLSDYGLHWKGTKRGAFRVDLAWDKLDRAEVIEARSGYDFAVASSDPPYDLRFRLYEDDNRVALMRQVVQNHQAML